MTIERALIGTTDAAAAASVYVEDVFQSYLYTGTSASQTINNGIDLATKGGLVWLKPRNQPYNNNLYDTSRGVNNFLVSNTTDPAYTQWSADLVTAFNTNGFTLGADANQWFANKSAVTYASWTFRKQAKFFDIVTYTGTGSARTISHNLGATPGMIIVKRTDDLYSWQVYHNGLTSAAYSLRLNQTNGQVSATTVWDSTAPRSSVFSVGTDITVNASGGTYVAYLFAASNSGGFGPAGTDSVVACGSFTTDASGNAAVSLGWEPQFVIQKCASQGGNWLMYDSMRGMPAAPAINAAYLLPNSSVAESTDGAQGLGYANPTATGFGFSGANASATYIYLAIRRGPMKTPTDATKVFAPIARTGTGSTASITSVGFPPDLIVGDMRVSSSQATFVDRLRGRAYGLVSANTNAETSYGPSSSSQDIVSFDMSGFTVTSNLYLALNVSGNTEVYWNFKRAPGFFDVVCYTGTGSATTVAHNLGVAPELMIIKQRNGTVDGAVYHSGLGGADKYCVLFSASGNQAVSTWTGQFNSTAPTSSVFTVGTGQGQSGYNYVAYLFASCPGVSKVFSYTGNGSSQTINCGFAAGARFVLIKRTDSTGDWYCWDSSRGIVSANDPHLSLNTTAAEVTTDDTIDPDNSGFIVNQVASTNVNVSSATYIGLAIA